MEEVRGDKRWEVNWRSERREGKGKESGEIKEVKGESERAKGRRRARSSVRSQEQQMGDLQEVMAKEKGVSRNKDGGTTGGR